MSAVPREFDRQMMDRALRVAEKGHPSPNPHVGALVVRGREVVARGYHRAVGQDHAEVVALKLAGEEARGSTLYVTFEPCNHQGRTAPCTEAIIKAGVARVVSACRDPAPHVPGAIEKLRKAGIDVTVGVREEQALTLVADFIKHFTTGRPFVTIKGGMTLDGKLATRSGDSKWITGELARREAHRLRSLADAVMVGVQTVVADDPELTVRHVRGRDPLRVVVDSRLRTPTDARVLSRSSSAGLVVFHTGQARDSRRQALLDAGAELVCVPEDQGGVDLDAVLDELGRRDVVRLLVEGGPRVHGSLLDAGAADRVALFVAPKIIGDGRALPLFMGRGVDRVGAAWRLTRMRTRALGEDLLITGDLAMSGGSS